MSGASVAIRVPAKSRISRGGRGVALDLNLVNVDRERIAEDFSIDLVADAKAWAPRHLISRFDCSAAGAEGGILLPKKKDTTPAIRKALPDPTTSRYFEKSDTESCWTVANRNVLESKSRFHRPTNASAVQLSTFEDCREAIFC